MLLLIVDDFNCSNEKTNEAKIVEQYQKLRLEILKQMKLLSEYGIDNQDLIIQVIESQVERAVHNYSQKTEFCEESA